MEAQKDWDSPIADSDSFGNSDNFADSDNFDSSTDSTDFADSDNFIDNLSIADLSTDTDSAQSPLDSGLTHDKKSGAANHRRWIALLVILAMIIAGAAGFAWRRDQQGNPSLLCDSQRGRVDALDYCYEGFDPLQPSGERLTLADAGPYFAKAVDNTYAADDAVRLAAAGGDKDAVHKAAATAHDRAQQAAETLAARTWPKSLTKPIRLVIIEYQERASFYANLTTNRNAEAIDWIAFELFRESGAQQLIRTTLKLPDEPAPVLPIDVTGFTDNGTCEGYDDDADSTAKVTRRCFTVTAVNRTNAEISGIIVKFNVLGKDGTIRETGAEAISETKYDKNDNPIEHGGIEHGGTVKLNMQIDPQLLREGDRFTLSTWSLQDRHGNYHRGAFTAAQSKSFDTASDGRSEETQ